MFLKVLFYFILGVIILRWLARLFLPSLGRMAMRKAQEQMQEQVRRQRDGEKVYDDGKITIRKGRSSSPSNATDNEDFVDYQEVD